MEVGAGAVQESEDSLGVLVVVVEAGAVSVCASETEDVAESGTEAAWVDTAAGAEAGDKVGPVPVAVPASKSVAEPGPAVLEAH